MLGLVMVFLAFVGSILRLGGRYYWDILERNKNYCCSSTYSS